MLSEQSPSTLVTLLHCQPATPLTKHNPGTALNAFITRTAIGELAGTGTLRAALNLGNDLFVRKAGCAGSFVGPAVELSRRLAELLHVPVDFVVYESAGAVCAACERDEWDMALLARDHDRAQQIALTQPYLLLAGAYAVPTSSNIYRKDQIDRQSTRIVVERNSVHDLFLSRTLESATILRVPTFSDLRDLARSTEYVVAADRHQLERANAATMHLRLLKEHSMVVEHAIGTPRGRHAAAALLGAYVHNLVTTRFLEFLLDLHGVGCEVTVPYAQFDAHSAPVPDA
ncbi:transporter substrate-binding domain-containing protein [Paraburkholderia tropica]|uniref:transporter substrate-binding domain-containing protein n=1 Tax=Paraburkholderia tropica TaxID=92647 RepID=UPI002AB0C0E6|nr:transporter substrate-binding domain-containing protein [Paraburkholderia tropica]